MKISLIIPTYKPQDYLWQCLDSVKNQTYPKKDFELILVLNGCNEPYNVQIKAYIEANLNDLVVNFIQTNQGGVSNARNIGLDQAKGEYIAFIDDDDFISPTYLEELYLKASPEIISLCYPLSFIDGTNKYEPYHITNNFKNNKQTGICNYKKARKYFSGPVYKLIHKDIIGNRRFDVRFRNGEDALFMFLISDRFKNVSFTSKNAVYYRRYREGSAVSTKRSRWSIINNRFKMICTYSHIYWGNPVKYSFNFYLTRMFGAVRGMMKL